MRVVIFKGDFQYGVVNDFAASIGKVLSENGAEVIFVDLTDPQVGKEIAQAFIQPINFVLSFGGIGYELMYKGQSFYDYMDATFVMWLVDHPVHFMERVQAPIKNKIVICIDESHVDYLENNLINSVVTSFIPHAANKEILQLQEKEYDILFAGHIADVEKYELQMVEFDKEFPGFLRLLNENLERKGNFHLDNFFEDLVSAFPKIQALNMANHNMKLGILRNVDLYVRAKKRKTIIQQLLNNKLTLHFFGQISEEHEFLNSPYFKHYAPVPFDEMKELYKKAKIVLNVLPNFPYGGHERIFSSMMCGAVPFTDTNSYIKQYVNSAISFEYNDLSKQIKEIQRLIGDENLLEMKIKENYAMVNEYHTWARRTEELLYVVEATKNYFKGIK